ncbi:Tim17/Tim22/Tim23/Pmp24 family [Fragilaria crotonensis]|nr:Tim17/Tim22/Tim23/Pmp24 family [Fragilaria crotonensis]
MILVRTPVLFLFFLATTTAHFSSPAHIRVIGVSSRRRALAPRSRPFGPRYHLFASSTSSIVDDIAAAEEEELGDDEVIPEDYETVVQVVPSKQHTKVIKPFKELGFGGKLVRGTRNIIVVTTTNFALGVSFGLITAGVRGFPNLMTRKEGLLGTPWNEEIPMRLKRYSGKCYRWAKIWGPVFAVWGFTDTAVSLLRNGDNDEFNFMIASSAAAVWHTRDKSVQRKAIVAVVYAALTYAYVKFNEYYVVGPEGWQDKYGQNEEVGTELQATAAAAGEISRGGDALSIGDQNDIY